MRYFGKKYGYYPADIKEAYEVDKLSDDFYDNFNAFFGPMFFPPGPAQDGAIEGAVAAATKFCKMNEARLAKGQFMMGPKLYIIDFWLGGLYTNIIANPDCYGREQWAAFLKAHPAYDAYGKRFAAANKEYLDRRGPSPT